ncbi:MAG: hypothetical protein AMXMBFR49_13750 [Chlorobiota bacterium]
MVVTMLVKSGTLIVQKYFEFLIVPVIAYEVKVIQLLHWTHHDIEQIEYYIFIPFLNQITNRRIYQFARRKEFSQLFCKPHSGDYISVSC